MNRPLPRAATVALCGLLLIASGFHAAPAGQEMAKVTAVVTVVSADGMPVTGLTAADFVIRDEGTRRDAASADSLAQVPLYVTVLIDMAKPPMGMIPPVRDMRLALGNFVAAIRAANPGAQISLVEVSGAPVPTVRFDAAEGALDAAVQKLSPGQNGDAVMLEGIAEAARDLKDRPTIRRAIVSIDFGSPDTSGESANRAAIDGVLDAQVSLFAVSIRMPRQVTSRRESGLTAAVDVSGGTRLTAVSATGLDAQLKTIAATLSSQYLVTFMRPGGVIKKLSIETTRGQKALVGALLR